MLAIVFGIKEDDVYSDICRMGFQLACYFEEYTHAAGTIIGTKDGGVVILGVSVGIGPGATVPMGTQQHSLLQFGLVRADDIACREYGAVVSSQSNAL